MAENRCEICARNFESEAALQQHNQAKHSADDKIKIKKKSSKLPLLVILVLVAIGIYFVFLQKPGYVPKSSHDQVKGNENGQISVVEFSDFQCPVCKAANPEVKKIMQQYGNVTRFVYKHFPIQRHVYASKAAEASECAGDQGRFWHYHDKLFDNQESINTDNIKKFASEIGLNMTDFTKCLDSGVMSSRVSKNYDEGRTKNIGGTPTFFVNRKEASGVLTVQKFKQLTGL